ncbi:hypothetical protein AGMMS49965_23910 [Bacteroidia bacterium]|nr:hypothetical protein AGMMS49965_23910 [Bacteroidia bacterium]
MCEEHSLYSNFKQKLFETTGVKFRRMKFEIVERIFEEAAKLGVKVLLENILPLSDSEKTEVPETYECPFLECELWISATGKISPCCAPDNLRQSLDDFGNIETMSLTEVLASENYLNLVENYKKIKLCKSCNMRKPKQ